MHGLGFHIPLPPDYEDEMIAVWQQYANVWFLLELDKSIGFHWAYNHGYLHRGPVEGLGDEQVRNIVLRVERLFEDQLAAYQLSWETPDCQTWLAAADRYPRTRIVPFTKLPLVMQRAMARDMRAVVRKYQPHTGEAQEEEAVYGAG